MPYESFVSPEISLIFPFLRTVTRILCVETNPTLLCWQRRRMRRSVRPTLRPVMRRDALDARTKHSSEFLTIPLGLQVSEWCLYNYRTRSLSLKLGHCLFYLTICRIDKFLLLGVFCIQGTVSPVAYFVSRVMKMYTCFHTTEVHLSKFLWQASYLDLELSRATTYSKKLKTWCQTSS